MQGIQPLIAPIKQAFSHQGFRKYFFNTGWLMADKVLRLFVGLFVGVYVARYLGPERFGVLNFAMSFVALFGAFATLGLDGIVVRNAVRDPDCRDELLGTAFGLRLIGGFILLAAVYGAIRLTDSDPLTRLMVMVIALGQVLQAFQVIEFYFQSQVMARLTAIAGMSGLIVSSAIKLGLIWSEASLVWFAWVVVAENGIKGIVLAILYLKQRIPLLRWRFRLNQAKMLLKDSWPLILSGLVVMVYMRIDQVMIKMMLDDKAVGNYAAAVKLSEAWYFIPFIIADSLFPALTKAKKKSYDAYLKKLYLLYSTSVLVGYLFAIFISIFSPNIIILLFGYEYVSSTAALAILSWGGIFIGLSRNYGIWLINENYTKKNVYRTSLGALVNIILNYLLIPKFNINGAAYSTLFSLFFANIVYDFFDCDVHIQLKVKLKSFIPFYSLLK
jgi:O-antigen/teichoic acid export membrane protein